MPSVIKGIGFPHPHSLVISKMLWKTLRVAADGHLKFMHVWPLVYFAVVQHHRTEGSSPCSCADNVNYIGFRRGTGSNMQLCYQYKKLECQYLPFRMSLYFVERNDGSLR